MFVSMVLAGLGVMLGLLGITQLLYVLWCDGSWRQEKYGIGLCLAGMILLLVGFIAQVVLWFVVSRFTL